MRTRKQAQDCAEAVEFRLEASSSRTITQNVTEWHPVIDNRIGASTPHSGISGKSQIQEGDFSGPIEEIG